MILSLISMMKYLAHLQKTVETMSARLILSDAVAPGQTIVLDVENGNLTARVEA